MKRKGKAGSRCRSIDRPGRAVTWHIIARQLPFLPFCHLVCPLIVSLLVQCSSATLELDLLASRSAASLPVAAVHFISILRRQHGDRHGNTHSTQDRPSSEDDRPIARATPC